MKKTIVVEQEKCTGCKLCELACSFEQTGCFNPSASRMKVELFEREFFYLPVTCQQCDDPYCAKVCPSHAININTQTGATEIDYNRCIGCRMCLTVCPFGGMDYSPAEAKVVKCDLCGGEPVCINSCPWDALEYTEAQQIAGKKRQQIAAKMKATIKEVG